jgi:hypothetical protein
LEISKLSLKQNISEEYKEYNEGIWRMYALPPVSYIKLSI